MTSTRRASLVLAAAVFAVLPGGAAAAQTPAPAQMSPSPSASPCGKPTVRVDDAFTVSPRRVASGETVTVEATVRGTYDLCHEPRESHEFRLLAREQGQAEYAEIDRRTVDTVNGRGYTYRTQPVTTTQYRLSIDGRPAAATDSTATPADGTGSPDTVVVDRTAGACAGALSLTAPALVPVGGQVVVNGRGSDTSTVSIAFRKRGQTGYTIRRTLTPSGPDNTFSTSYTADDDYRLYALTGRCESPSVLVQAAPTVSGPPTARRDSTVTLSVRAAAGQAVQIAFRRQGQSAFQVRRTGTADARGLFTTTYVADTDYRYRAQERLGQTSSTGLTQAR